MCGKIHKDHCDDKYSSIKCYCYRESGHTRPNCLRREDACYICGVLGHRKRDWPQPSREESRASIHTSEAGGSQLKKSEMPKANAQAFQMTMDEAREMTDFVIGWGTNEGLIISILCHRNADQRKLIRHAYAETYKEDLLKALDKELSSDFERIVLLWTLDPPERDAFLVNEATKKGDKSNQVLVEIACTRSAQDLLLARKAYHARYQKSLEEDVAHCTTGDFRKLLWPLVTGYRYEGEEVDIALAKTDAKLLHEKITETCYNDDDFIRILTTRSKAQINAILNQYKYQFGQDINKDLKEDPNNGLLTMIRTTIKCLTYPVKHFEKMLRLAINRQGTDESTLARIVATRAEFDMKLIKEEYKKRNSVSLDEAIKKDTRGDYEDMLLALVGSSED